MARRPAALARDGWLVLVFALYGLVAASFLVLNMPPYQNPDETNHFLRADNIERGYLVGHRFGGGVASGGWAAPEIAASGAPFDEPKFHPAQKVTLGEYQRSFAKFGGAPIEINFPNTAVYPPVFYAPAVLAVWIGKTGRLSVVQTLYLARALTALASMACVAVALSLCLGAGANGAALLIFVLATLPMSLSLMASVSQDGPMLGAAALAAAWFVRLRIAPRGRDLVLLCIALALIAAARPPYAPLAAALLFLRVRWPARILAVAAVLLAAGLWAVWANAAAGVVMLAGRDPAAQARVLLDPARTARVLADTVTTFLPAYGVSFVGQLGWLDVTLPKWFIAVAGYVLALAALAAISLRGAEAAGMILAVLGAGLAVLFALYLTWTDVGGPVVLGVQGRYFLPPALLLAGLGTRLPGGWFGWAVRGAACALPAIGLGVTMRAIVVRYYLGA